MEKTLIFGHKNPDTDTVCSAIAYAHLKNAIGEEAEAARLGEPNKETDFALNHFGVRAPRMIDQVDNDVTDVILVDHNEFQQSVDNIQDVRIAEVIDHHRVADFETKSPLYMRLEPVGCTATILKKIFEEKNVEIDKPIAGLLLSSIISDSLLFKSPTCTQEDIDAAHELAKIADVDPDEYGLEMLKAGTDLSDKSARDMLTMDAKPFNMGGQAVEIAQVNTFDLEQVYERQDELEKEMDDMIAQKDLGLVLFVATDILNSNSEVLARGPAKDNVEKAFHVSLNNDRAVLEGVVSRKKQIVTSLTDAFE